MEKLKKTMQLLQEYYCDINLQVILLSPVFFVNVKY